MVGGNWAVFEATFMSQMWASHRHLTSDLRRISVFATKDPWRILSDLVTLAELDLSILEVLMIKVIDIRIGSTNLMECEDKYLITQIRLDG
jgi:hypothetical protein